MQLNILNSEFSLLIRMFTRGFIALTHAFNLATRDFSVLTRGFELVTRRFELATRGFKLATRGFKLVTCNSCFSFPSLCLAQFRQVYERITD